MSSNSYIHTVTSRQEIDNRRIVHANAERAQSHCKGLEKQWSFAEAVGRTIVKLLHKKGQRSVRIKME